MQHHLEKYEQSELEVIDQLRHQIYVDDFLAVLTQLKMHFSSVKSLRKLMKAGGMNLRKVQSNSKQLMEGITDNVESLNYKTSSQNSETKLSKNETLEGDTSHVKTMVGPQQISENSSATKVLGISWDTDTDQFYFDFSELIHYASSLPVTKCSVQKLTGHKFDPLGFLSLVMTDMKTIFQILCQKKISWDAELEGDLLSKYYRFISELQRLSDVRIPRCLFTNHAVDYQLHGYSGASDLAYACIIYLRSQHEDGHMETRLVTSKSKVAPLKRQTTQHLELLSAGILTKHIFTVNQSLISTPKLNITKSLFLD